MRRLVLVFLTALLSAQSTPEVEITAEPHHHQVLVNDQIRVFNVDVAPHAETLMHWHRHDYIFVTLGATEVVNAVKGKPPVTLKLQDGDTYFLPATFAHIARNLADQPFRNVTIEILQDEKLRHAPSPWKEDRGLELLEAGTQQILWVKDGIRASLFELKPGGVVPLHHHAGPHLAVALTDIKFRSQIPGQVPGQAPGKEVSEVDLAPGESLWLEGGYSHILTNLTPHPVKWITLEFP